MNLVRLYFIKEDQKAIREEQLLWKEEGERFLRSRERLGLSRAYVSRLTGFGYRQISRFEKGLPTRDADEISAIVDYFFIGVDFYQMTTGSICDDSVLKTLYEYRYD